jgi:hypothetical protein
MPRPALAVPFLLICLTGCGQSVAGSPAYAGSWPSFVVNGSQNLGGFVVDSRGSFQFSAPGAQVTGQIAVDNSLSGAAQGAGGGVCTLEGRCSSTTICNGTTIGSGCPLDQNGRPWATFALCRGAGC